MLRKMITKMHETIITKSVVKAQGNRKDYHNNIFVLYKTAVYILCVEMLGNARCRHFAKQEKPFEKMS